MKNVVATAVLLALVSGFSSLVAWVAIEVLFHP
jgi:hypothetical protein